MTRNVMLLIVAATIALLVFAGVSKFFDARKIQDLQDRETAQQIAAQVSDERNAVLAAQLTADSVARDSLELVNATLRLNLQRAQTQRVRIVQVRDSARATIDPDTLSPGYRNLLLIEREMAEGETVRADLAETLLKSSDAQNATLLERQRALRILLLDVTAQRDSALVLVGDAIDAASPSFFRDLFKDIPRKLACAGGGAMRGCARSTRPRTTTAHSSRPCAATARSKSPRCSTTGAWTRTSGACTRCRWRAGWGACKSSRCCWRTRASTWRAATQPRACRKRRATGARGSC
ncbi:hypothetical protein LCGC14_1435260 [marine sediment metagenome]|uniref:Uncharacterized protein n=1 Tax=marine sediment metagenome TaxID=412755 RepID=A0A0F9M2W6_9ZZZZ